MAEFTAELLRVIAMGPDPSDELLAAVKVVQEKDGSNKALAAYDSMRGKWSKEQVKLHKRSRELLYAAVMLRAAGSLDQSNQDRLQPEQRQAESSICFRLISKSLDQPANRRMSDNKSGHEVTNVRAAAAATDPEILVATFGISEDEYASKALRAFSKRGLACPPDPK